MSLTLSQFLKEIPKAELHYHLLGGVRLETMLDLAHKYGVPLTEKEAKSYYRAYAHENEVMKGGIAALNFLYPLLREPEDYARVAYEILEDAKNSGIRYVEFFWNPNDTELPYQVVTDTLAVVFEEAEAKWNISAYLIPSINREKSPEEAVEMVEWMIAYPHPRVLGIGIDYREDDAPIEKFWKAYRLAKENNLRLTGHCSEFGLHWRNVETGLDLIGLERIDHGYTVVENPELMQRCVDERIPFTVVPSNTFFLKKWPNLEEWQMKHPIRQMAKAGMVIIPATDDWHMHNTDGQKCYQVMIENFGFDLDGVRQCIENGINAAWQPESVKEKWRQEWLAEFDQLRSALTEEPTFDPEFHTPYQLS
ncbi:adenosine deaminase [Ignatzschineria indica]|uniref:Adenosine deaminase n=1 Tax=Ignatzschineria indica TaxID=472583 RepID=A0A2U2AK12_9GAMM|nr:adenosine deaminase [Ignatzschineria indica]PWD83167.1 adenosine deaminase [Ignatzschineria indica]GGZ82383.1 adenosine deaminase [Ignatzschineria indica]